MCQVSLDKRENQESQESRENEVTTVILVHQEKMAYLVSQDLREKSD